MRPIRLVDFLAGQKINHDWLYVEDRYSIYSVWFGGDEFAAFDPNNATDVALDAIGTIFTTLCENANGWPSHVVSWVMGTRNDFRRLDFVKEE